MVNYPMEPLGAQQLPVKMERDDITVRENIDRKIEFHKAQIADLEKSRDQLAPLLDMRIDLLRQAMMIGR